ATERQCGPWVLFGAGGGLVEVLQDRALGLPPLNRTLARRLMERTRIYPALKGVRGQKPVDLEALETMLARFSRVKTLSRESLIRLCPLDYDREMALVAVRRHDGGSHMLGVSRYYLTPETGEAEFALGVGDAHQGKGLGRHLLQRLIEIARERGVRRLIGLVLRENGPMLALTSSLGFGPAETVDDGVVQVSLDL